MIGMINFILKWKDIIMTLKYESNYLCANHFFCLNSYAEINYYQGCEGFRYCDFSQLFGSKA
jgi:hypothetical protein